jgi:hypothetical protein
MNLNLGTRVPNALPYVVIALGVLFYAFPFVPFLEGYSFFLVHAGYPYVTAGVFVWFVVRGKVEKSSYVLAVPAVTFLVLAGAFLYYVFPGTYALSTNGIFVYGSVSFLFVLGYTAGMKEWKYVGVSALAYVVCIFVVVPPTSLGLNSWNLLLLAGVLALTLGTGTPLALVAYAISGVYKSE